MEVNGIRVDVPYLQELSIELNKAIQGGAIYVTRSILVMNGDVLTDVNFQAMLDFHVEQNADMTVAVAIQKIEIPYGVVDTDGLHIINIKEKPVLQHFVNAGVYLINPCLFDYIPESLPFDMPDLISTIIEAKLRVISFPVHEYWVDIGKRSDYEQAIMDLDPISTDDYGDG